MTEQVVILIPIYNDATSLNQLLSELTTSLQEFNGTRFSILAIDDGSSEKLEINTSHFFSVQVLHLQRNIGHQKAIAIGMAYCRENIAFDKLLVMDGDGEDKPEDAARLLKAASTETNKVIFAKRASRQEGQRFQFCKSYSNTKRWPGFLPGNK